MTRDEQSPGIAAPSRPASRAPARRVAFATLGCRLNQVDTEELQGRLEARGFRTVGGDAAADVLVVNTCTVTARAEASDRQMIRRLARRNPQARLVVTGCWAQTDRDAVASLPGVHLVVGNSDKHRLAELVDSLMREGELATAPRLHVSDVSAVRAIPVAPLPRTRVRSRAFVKVQEGCQHRCAFCIVPAARGPSRSLERERVLERVRSLVEAGHPEIVLTGVDLGHYGADLLPRTTLASLLGDMVQIAGLRWIRLSSMLPAYFTPELLDVVTASRVIAPHFHVPLQSGSDRVLRRMRRPYTVAMYRRVVDRLVAARPALGLGADVIVGHPGEGAADFAETLALVDAVPFTYLHVFAYSDRRGTEAARLDGRVDRGMIAERSERLRRLADAKNRAFRERLVGTREEVLVLDTRDASSGRLVGLTGNYVEVLFAGDDTLMRSLARVRITAADATATLGELA